jgi:hypothetical protein
MAGLAPRGHPRPHPRRGHAGRAPTDREQSIKIPVIRRGAANGFARAEAAKWSGQRRALSIIYFLGGGILRTDDRNLPIWLHLPFGITYIPREYDPKAYFAVSSSARVEDVLISNMTINDDRMCLSKNLVPVSVYNESCRPPYWAVRAYGCRARISSEIRDKRRDICGRCFNNSVLTEYRSVYGGTLSFIPPKWKNGDAALEMDSAKKRIAYVGKLQFLEDHPGAVRGGHDYGGIGQFSSGYKLFFSGRPQFVSRPPQEPSGKEEGKGK